MGFKGILFLLIAFWCVFETRALGSTAQNFWSAQPQGWNWYKDPEPPKPPETKKTHQAPSLESVSSIKKKFQEKLENAIMHPTVENVREVQILQRRIFERASRFEDMWMLASLLHGEDFRREDQTNGLHRKIFEAEQEQALSQAFSRLSKRFGLFLLFQKSCPYCQEFAPIVREFAALYGFSVLAVTADQGTLPGLKVVPDNGLIKNINPRRVFPVLFLMSYEGRAQMIPLSWGLVSLSDLKANAKRVVEMVGGRTG